MISNTSCGIALKTIGRFGASFRAGTITLMYDRAGEGATGEVVIGEVGEGIGVLTAFVKAGLVDASWSKQSYKGMVTDSVVVFVVRKGNPKGIKTWDDLIKPSVEIVTPNPFSSGAARWNILAGYGAKSKKGTDQAAGNAYLKSFFDNVVVQDDSGRKALQTFTGGKGDVLLSYENEAIFAQQNGEDIDYVVARIEMSAMSRHQHAKARRAPRTVESPETPACRHGRACGRVRRSGAGLEIPCRD